LHPALSQYSNGHAHVGQYSTTTGSSGIGTASGGSERRRAVASVGVDRSIDPIDCDFQSSTSSVVSIRRVVSSSTARPHSSPRGVRHDARHRASARDRGDDAAAVRVRVHVVVRVVVARVERARRPIIIIIIIIIITVASGAFYHHTGPHTTPFAM
jgi:hypothetical protein